MTAEQNSGVQQAQQLEEVLQQLSDARHLAREKALKRLNELLCAGGVPILDAQRTVMHRPSQFM